MYSHTAWLKIHDCYSIAFFSTQRKQLFLHLAALTRKTISVENSWNWNEVGNWKIRGFFQPEKNRPSTRKCEGKTAEQEPGGAACLSVCHTLEWRYTKQQLVIIVCSLSQPLFRVYTLQPLPRSWAVKKNETLQPIFFSTLLLLNISCGQIDRSNGHEVQEIISYVLVITCPRFSTVTRLEAQPR